MDVPQSFRSCSGERGSTSNHHGCYIPLRTSRIAYKCILSYVLANQHQWRHRHCRIIATSGILLLIPVWFAFPIPFSFLPFPSVYYYYRILGILSFPLSPDHVLLCLPFFSFFFPRIYVPLKSPIVPIKSITDEVKSQLELLFFISNDS